MKFELKKVMEPYHGNPFPVPQILVYTLKREVIRLLELGVSFCQPESEWGLPTFIIPKKNMTVIFIKDFWEVSKWLKFKLLPIPKTIDVFQKLQVFQFAMALDLNMGYYTIKLDPTASMICTIVLPWGKYSYKRLPMGMTGSPDIFQEKISGLMIDLEFERTYLDDLLILTKYSLF